MEILGNLWLGWVRRECSRVGPPDVHRSTVMMMIRGGVVGLCLSCADLAQAPATVHVIHDLGPAL